MSYRTPQALKNRKTKDRQKRAKLRRRLEAQGMPPEKIDRIIKERQRLDLAARYGYSPPPKYDPANDDSYQPDDKGYRPSAGDPLLRGAARATGVTARVVKRRHTITRYQHEQETR